MIYALTRRTQAFGLGDYLESDGAAVSHLVTMLSYEQAFDEGRLPVGAYIFAGLDQLTPTELALVTRTRDALAAACPAAACLNDPRRWRPRLALLQTAFDAGINSFRATRATQAHHHRRFPVFVRSELEHTGGLSPLLFDRASLVGALLLAVARGYRLRDLLVVEYSDTSVDGVFTKYSAMVLGPDVVPRAAAVSRHWVTKYGGSAFDRQASDLDLRYVEANPHQAWVREMCEMGGVEYGRIDYAVVNGKPQLWEINTNPTVGPNLAEEPPSTRDAPLALGLGNDTLYLRERGNRLFYQKFGRAIEGLAARTREAMDAFSIAPREIEVPITPAERRRVARERVERERVLARDTIAARLASPMLTAIQAVRRNTGAYR